MKASVKTSHLGKGVRTMNEYVESQDDVRCSDLMLVAQRARRSKSFLSYYLAVTILAGAHTLSAANLAESHSRVKRSVPERHPVAAADVSAGSTTFNTDQGPGPGPIGPGPGCNLLP